MSEKEQVLKEALRAGIDFLTEKFGEDYDRELVLKNVPLLVEVMWPFIEGYHKRRSIARFEDLFQERFPNHNLEHFGGSVFDYIVGNVQSAVSDEIIRMLETWADTIRETKTSDMGRRTGRQRDWDVALAHTNEIISRVRQYKTLGSSHTGSIPVLESNDS